MALAVTALFLGTPPLAAQDATPFRGAIGDRWTLDAHYLQLNAKAIGRHAAPSMSAAVGRDMGGSGSALAWRLEAGWMRAARPATTAQGATLGVSAGFPLRMRADGEVRLTVRPGIALMAGWAEGRGVAWLYDWQGQPGTMYAGATGSEVAEQPVRGRTSGAGLSIGAELRLSHGLGVAGSARGWSFGGDAIRPNRHVVLAGLGLTMHPRTFASDVRRVWRTLGAPEQQTPAPAAAAAPPVDTDSGTTHATHTRSEP